jgi:hypothetical protein
LLNLPSRLPVEPGAHDQRPEGESERDQQKREKVFNPHGRPIKDPRIDPRKPEIPSASRATLPVAYPDAFVRYSPNRTRNAVERQASAQYEPEAGPMLNRLRAFRGAPSAFAARNHAASLNDLDFCAPKHAFQTNL